MAKRKTMKVPDKDKEGNCFVVAGSMMLEESDASDWMKLVHGTVLADGGKYKGCILAHAWIEIGGTVAVDFSNGNSVVVRATDYYKAAGIGLQESPQIIRYSLEELKKKLLQYEHWGPWDLDMDGVL